MPVAADVSTDLQKLPIEVSLSLAGSRLVGGISEASGGWELELKSSLWTYRPMCGSAQAAVCFKSRVSAHIWEHCQTAAPIKQSEL